MVRWCVVHPGQPWCALVCASHWACRPYPLSRSPPDKDLLLPPNACWCMWLYRSSFLASYRASRNPPPTPYSSDCSRDCLRYALPYANDTHRERWWWTSKAPPHCFMDGLSILDQSLSAFNSTILRLSACQAALTPPNAPATSGVTPPRSSSRRWSGPTSPLASPPSLRSSVPSFPITSLFTPAALSPTRLAPACRLQQLLEQAQIPGVLEVPPCLQCG